MSKFSTFLVQACVLILCINAAGIWMYGYLKEQEIKELKDQQKVVNELLGVQQDKTGTVQEGYAQQTKELNQDKKYQTRLDSVEEKQDDIEKRLKELDKKLQKTAKTDETEVKISVSGAKQRRIYSLYLGSGSRSALDWGQIGSTAIRIDTANYSNISAVYLDAGLSLAGGDAYARLVNTSNGGVIANSQVTHNSSTTTWKTSNAFSLDAGNNQYIIELRSSSAENVNLAGARMRILAD